MRVFKRAWAAAVGFLLLTGWGSVCMAAQTDFGNRLELDVKYYHFDQQVDWGAGKEDLEDSNSGRLDGIYFSYTNQNLDGGSYWQITYAQTHHDTRHFQTNQDVVIMDSLEDNRIYNVEFVYANPLSGFEDIYIYLGVGAHYWARELSASQKVEYGWLYIPFGLRFEQSFGERLRAAMELTVQFMGGGKARKRVSGYDLIEVDLGNKPGYRIKFPFTYQISPRWGVALTPWCEYSAIGESEVGSATQGGSTVDFQVQDSTTEQYGIDIGFQMSF